MKVTIFFSRQKNADGHCYDSSSVEYKICDLANKWLSHENNLQRWMNERNCPPIFEKYLAAVGEIFSNRRLVKHLKSSNIIMSFLQHEVNDVLTFPGKVVKSFLFSSLKFSDIFIKKYVVEDGWDCIHADIVSSRVVNASSAIATNISFKFSEISREAESSTFIATNITSKEFKNSKEVKISTFIARNITSEVYKNTVELKPSTYIATNITSQESKSSKEMKLFPSSATSISSTLSKNSRGADVEHSLRSKPVNYLYR